MTYVVDTTGNVNQYDTIGGVSLSYDTRGNLTVDKDGYQYFYDYENRITQIKDSSNSVVVNYTYDALGRRIEKDDVVASVVTRYYYDSQRVLLETDGSQNDQRAYVYGNYIDEALIMTDYTAQDDPDYFYGHDHLYSAVVLFDDGGVVVERYEYDAYGNVRIMDASYNSRTASSCGNTCLFTGRTLDTIDNGDLKIYYYRARYYDPETGRFLQRDPLNYVDGMNLYEYVGSHPLLYRDPLGLFLPYYWPDNASARTRSLEHAKEKQESRRSQLRIGQWQRVIPYDLYSMLCSRYKVYRRTTWQCEQKCSEGDEQEIWEKEKALNSYNSRIEYGGGCSITAPGVPCESATPWPGHWPDKYKDVVMPGCIILKPSKDVPSLGKLFVFDFIIDRAYLTQQYFKGWVRCKITCDITSQTKRVYDNGTVVYGDGYHWTEVFYGHRAHYKRSGIKSVRYYEEYRRAHVLQPTLSPTSYLIFCPKFVPAD